MSERIKPEARKPKMVAVLKNALTCKEADAIVDGSLERGGPFMSLAETLAHAARLEAQKESKKHLAE